MQGPKRRNCRRPPNEKREKKRGLQSSSWQGEEKKETASDAAQLASVGARVVKGNQAAAPGEEKVSQKKKIS